MTDTKQELLDGIEDGSIADKLSTPLNDTEVEGLVKRAKSDPGSPFEGEAIARIAATKIADLPGFIRLRSRLKGIIIVGELDKAIERVLAKGEAADDAEDGSQGRPITFPRIDLLTQPVDGATLLDEIEMQIKRHVMLSPEAAVAVALWIIHAYCFQSFAISARLGIVSPEKRCGKTTLMSFIEALVPRPLMAANVTVAAVFRTIEKYRPTLLIDEADTFLGDNEELRGVINSGHRADGQVIRLVGDDHEPRAFATFSPTAIAAIGNLPGTIEDRAIKITMRRRLATETVVRFRSDRAHQFHDVRRKAARWAADNEPAHREADPAMPQGLHDRACDNWRPLLAIADVAGWDWPRRARAAAEALSREGAEQDEQSATVALLGDIRVVWARRSGGKAIDRISSTELACALAELTDRPWATWGRGKPITPNAVARRLKLFGIVPNTIKLADGKQPNGYKRGQFDEAFARYLPDQPDSQVHSTPSSPDPANPGATGHSQGSPPVRRGEVAKPAQSPGKRGRGEDGDFLEAGTGVSDEDDGDASDECYAEMIRRLRS